MMRISERTAGGAILLYCTRARLYELSQYLAFGILPEETLNDACDGLHFIRATLLGGGDA